MTYALGRGLEPSDMPIVRQIVRGAARDQYRFGAIVEGIISSEPFRMRVRPSNPESGIGNQESARNQPATRNQESAANQAGVQR